MSDVVKVAISLPRPLLEAADHERQARGESRSAFIRHALEDVLQRQRERDAVERYIRSYTELPESDAEVEQAQAVSAVILVEERRE